ncbi:MAG: extracellular solute-binding protein [Propionibacteriaceae bacterium]|jgi:multiple sugar transport system substrate-binding protein|nr:extracellular solute-binding protein [Propionibacteriaceae bacterium]
MRSTTRVAAVAAAIVLIATASACGSQSNDSESPSASASESASVTEQALTVWFPGNLPEEMELVNDKLVPEFEAQHPGVEVTVEFVAWGDLSTRLSTAFAGGTVPDVFGHGVAATAGFADGGRLAPLDSYVAGMSAQDKEDLTFLEAGQVDGVQYQVPLRGFGYLVAYRGDQAEEAGLDTTKAPADWDTLRAWAEALTVKDGETITRSGFTVPADAPTSMNQAFGAFLYQAGGSFVDDKGTTVTWDSPEGVAALEFIAAIYNGPDAVGTGIGDAAGASGAQHALCTGATAMSLVSDEVMKSIAAQAPDCAANLVVVPPLTEKVQASFGGSGNGLFISADSPNQDLAWDFIEFMVSPDVSRDYVLAVGGIPSRASAAADPAIAQLDYLAPYIEAAPFFQGNPNIVTWTQVRDALGAKLEEAFRGVTEPAAALEAAAQEAQAIIDQES